MQNYWFAMVLTEDKEFWHPISESHDDIIAFHNLKPLGEDGSPLVMRVSLMPAPDHKRFRDYASWGAFCDPRISEVPNWAIEQGQKALIARAIAVLVRRETR